MFSNSSWDNFYARALTNLPSTQDDEDADPGTSWFAEHNAPEKVLEFLTDPEFPLAPENHADAISILDLGTGNGTMLRLLRDEGEFEAKGMVGVDYSEASVELAKKLEEKDQEDEEDRIQFEVHDLLTQDAATQSWFPAQEGGFDIVLDKGTFDAISLSDEIDGATGKRVCERYPSIVEVLVKEGGYLVVTSCNWDETEVRYWFEKSGQLEFFDRVKYPKFRFGGQEGQGVVTICFKRKETSS